MSIPTEVYCFLVAGFAKNDLHESVIFLVLLQGRNAQVSGFNDSDLSSSGL
ncbi:hypothetical protein J4410_01030 [Candidatus Woesearchaeota archaeon]|nr:hypothetical protein [Candidatus Woesearchaeota archaeon]